MCTAATIALVISTLKLDTISSSKNRRDKRRGRKQRCHVTRDECILAPVHAPANYIQMPHPQQLMRRSILKLDIDDACSLHAGAVSFGCIGLLYTLTIAMGWPCYWVINVMVKSHLLQNIFIITGIVILCLVDKWRTRALHFYHHTILLYHYSVGKSANAPCPMYSVGKSAPSVSGVGAALA